MSYAPKDAESPEKLKVGSPYSPVAVVLNAEESRTQNFRRELLRRGWRIEEFTCKNWQDVIQKGYGYLRALRGARFVLAGMGFPWQGVWLLLAKFLGRHVVLDCPMDVTEKPFAHAWHWKKLIGFFSRRADIFLTLASREYLIQKFGLDSERVLFLENCPDLERIERGLRAPPVFRFPQGSIGICSSGVVPWHRFDRFVPVYKHLRSRLPNLVWLIISDLDSEMVRRLREQAQELRILDSIQFLPVIHPFESFVATVAQSHLWVSHLGDDSLLGRQELRMELLEMGVLAMPAVAVSTPALEMHGFVDGKNIILINPDDPEGSAERISHCLKHPSESKHLGDSLRQHVLERFSLAESIDRLVDAMGKR